MMCPYCGVETQFPLIHVLEFHPLWAKRYEHASRIDPTNVRGGPYTGTSTRVGRLVKLYGKACLACGSTKKRLTVDHVVPLSMGGADNIGNWQPLCAPCNQAKGRTLVDYRAAAQA